jgi:prevent-host-death family protein
MTVVPLGEAKDHLSEYVSEVARTRDRVTITRHGRPVAVLISVDDMERIEETLDILSTPGEYDAIREGLQQADRGEYVDADALKARYGIRPGD